MPSFNESGADTHAPPTGTDDVSPPRIVVLVRPGCHLCDDAVAVVAKVCRETGTHFATRDITGDAELTRLYTNEIPVTFVDGRQHDFWRVDEARLRAALAQRPQGSRRPAVPH